MALATRTATTDLTNAGVIVHTWEGLDGDDVGSVIKLAANCEMTVQLGANGGNTHGNGTVVFQGSNDPVAETDPANAVWFTLTDGNGNAISRTTAALLERVWESPLYVRPSQSGGTAADIDVILTVRKRAG